MPLMSAAASWSAAVLCRFGIENRECQYLGLIPLVWIEGEQEQDQEQE
jgi:hypothetical protein